MEIKMIRSDVPPQQYSVEDILTDRESTLYRRTDLVENTRFFSHNRILYLINDTYFDTTKADMWKNNRFYKTGDTVTISFGKKAT